MIATISTEPVDPPIAVASKRRKLAPQISACSSLSLPSLPAGSPSAESSDHEVDQAEHASAESFFLAPPANDDAAALAGAAAEVAKILFENMLMNIKISLQIQ